MTIANISDTPKYNIKAVCAQTGIRAVTLRAWERRYRFVSPQRTASNYRLYSDRDVALLRWLKGRVDEGLAISSAAAELAEMRQRGQWPDPLPALRPEPRVASAEAPGRYVARLYRALTTHDEAGAAAVLAEAHAVFDVPTMCTEVFIPCLVEIGEAWGRGTLRIATEHFASSFLRGRLLTLFQALPVQRGGPRVVVGCAPGEMHDIGALILALFLRRDGFRVEFLGPDVHVDDLLAYARDARPAIICLSAGSEEAVRHLRRVQAGLQRMRPRPKFGFGGRAFNLRPALRETVPGVFMGETVPAACAAVHRLLAN
jgi:DNA-binding transcriptional MerR regulator